MVGGRNILIDILSKLLSSRYKVPLPAKMSFATDTDTPATFLPVSPPRRSVTAITGYSQHEAHEETANIINDMIGDLIESAMVRIATELGFDIWSRSLDDWEHAYAVVLPRALYYDESAAAHDFRRTLKDWITAVFATHYIYINAEWRDSSKDPESEFGGCIYEVDWCGSRHRVVNLGPHLYLTFHIRCTGTRRPPLDTLTPAEIWPEGIPYKWKVICDQPDCYTVNYSVEGEPWPAEAEAEASNE